MLTRSALGLAMSDRAKPYLAKVGWLGGGDCPPAPYGTAGADTGFGGRGNRARDFLRHHPLLSYESNYYSESLSGITSASCTVRAFSYY